MIKRKPNRDRYTRIKAGLHFLDLLELDYADVFGSNGAPLPDGYVKTFQRLTMRRIMEE